MSAPLQGIRVLDFTRVLSGPYATMTLADLGADVVKIEPVGGDDTRAFGPPFADGVSTYYLSINRGKRSLELDLRRPDDRALALRLAAVADVVIENFRPGVMQRLGLGWEALRALNPRLVYCAISGFGQADPGPGYDLIIQGLSGIPSLTGTGEVPWKCGASIADLMAGNNAVQGVLAALLRRERTGEGGFVDVSMLDGQLALLTYHASAWLNAGAPPRALGNEHPSIHPFRTYRAADGWVNVAVGNDSLFVALCGLLQVPWAGDERFATNAARVRHRRELDALLGPRMLERTVQGWLGALGEVGVPCGPMATVDEALARARPVTHVHPSGAGEVRTLPGGFSVSEAPRTSSRGAPALGADYAAVLADWLGA